MSGLEQAYVQQVFESNWIAPLGPMVDAFEADPSTNSGQGSPRPRAHG
jgi:pyridoxal phosphate-dependent aminotransferase EpsN